MLSLKWDHRARICREGVQLVRQHLEVVEHIGSDRINCTWYKLYSLSKIAGHVDLLGIKNSF